MRQLLDRFKNHCADFVEQRDDLLMLIACSEVEAPIALKLVEEVEQANATDVFLLFSDDFIAPGPYVDVAIERLREQHQLACNWLAEQNREPLPPFPAALADHESPPGRRLGQAMLYARSLLPSAGGHRLVWTMIPQRIVDRDAYLDLVKGFAPYHGIKPGMQGLRLIFRDESDTASYRPELAAAPRVRVRPFELSQATIEQGLIAEVEDESLSDEQRMQALVSVALFDYAHHRKTESLEKLKVLLGYYQHTGNSGMQAFVLNTAGDVYRRDGEHARARHCYECAVPLAIEAEDTVAFHNAVQNLGDVAFAEHQYALAEQYYASADQLAAHRLDPEAKLRALEQRGLSQAMQGAHDRAIGSWEDAATLSRHIGLPTFLKTNLEHLERGYRQLGHGDRVAAVRTELAQLQREQHHELA